MAQLAAFLNATECMKGKFWFKNDRFRALLVLLQRISKPKIAILIEKPETSEKNDYFR